MNFNPHKFLLVGTGSYSNRGCEAIVRGTVEILSKRFPQSRFTLSSFGNNLQQDKKNETDDKIEHRMPNDPSIKRFTLSWWKYRIFLRPFPALQRRFQFDVQHAAIKETDCALEIGGDNYTLDYGIPAKFISMDKMLFAARKPVVLWGASIGPFSKKPKLEKIMRKHLRKFSLICARETETVSYLKSIGIEKNVKLVADPAFMMHPEQPVLSNKILQILEKHPVGLNLSPLIGRYRPEHQENQWIKEAGECIAQITDSDINPLILVPHVMDKGNNDYEFMVKAVENGPGWSNRLSILPPNLSAAEYKWVISKFRAFAGARTHSTIAALSSNIPTLSIGYSIKAKGINRDIFGHINWMIPIKDFTPDLLLKKIKELLSCEQHIRTELEEKNIEMKARAMASADYLAEVF